jgi:hypothetical protein
MTEMNNDFTPNPTLSDHDRIMLPKATQVQFSSLPKKQVQFSTVTIKEYPIIIGCNPGVSAGVPMSIDWDCFHQVILSINEYETMRIPQRVTDIGHLLLKAEDRYIRLQNLGFTYQELRLAEQAATSSRNLRYESYLDEVDDSADHYRHKCESQRRWTDKISLSSLMGKKRSGLSHRPSAPQTGHIISTKWWSPLRRRVGAST